MCMQMEAQSASQTAMVDNSGDKRGERAKSVTAGELEVGTEGATMSVRRKNADADWVLVYSNGDVRPLASIACSEDDDDNDISKRFAQEVIDGVGGMDFSISDTGETDKVLVEIKMTVAPRVHVFEFSNGVRKDLEDSFDENDEDVDGYGFAIIDAANEFTQMDFEAGFV